MYESAANKSINPKNSQVQEMHLMSDIEYQRKTFNGHPTNKSNKKRQPGGKAVEVKIPHSENLPLWSHSMPK
jgi:hypothetical protein